MAEIELIATTTFGLESVVKWELQDLGCSDFTVDNGQVIVKAEERDIPRLNLWLRCAERVLLKMGSFRALSFEELFDKTYALPWEEWITEDGEFTVVGKSVKSRLYSVPDCQSIVKKAIVEKLKTKYRRNWFPETGPKYTVQVALLKDVATLTIDTSGSGLHKRGYRQLAVQAPLKETLAAALVKLSYWNPDRLLVDPMCGSGTIAIEAALIGRNIAPGLDRSFAAEEWPRLGRKLWKEARIEARNAIDLARDIRIYASDRDPRATLAARENALAAGVDDCIRVETRDLTEVNFRGDYGVVICNPPYAERLGEEDEIEQLYRQMGQILNRLDTWSIYVLTANQNFERLFGRRADRKRKLYNGRIRVDYYQFYGPRPPAKFGS